jgi:hypothetical protein
MRYNGQINSKNRTQAERRTLMKKRLGEEEKPVGGTMDSGRKGRKEVIK